MQKASNSLRKQVRNQYLSGINEVLDYIEKNIITRQEFARKSYHLDTMSLE